MSATLRPGDWVTDYGQVLAGGSHHPDDVRVELFSHNEQYEVYVLRDRVTKILPPQGVAFRCTSLYPLGVGFAQCSLHERHGGDHAFKTGGMRWTDADESGRLDSPNPASVDE
jgi:hypothetical protein